MKRRVYLVGSLREPSIPYVARALRAEGHLVFDDWYAAGPRADEHWQEYETNRGRTYFEALTGPVAEHNFEFDKGWLDWADTGILVLPAGKSAHMELGYLKGRGAETFVLFPGDPERYDLMYLLADQLHLNIGTLLEGLSKERNA